MDGLAHDQKEWLPAFAITIQIITTILLGVRLASRLAGQAKIGWDDFLISIAWVLGTAQTVAVLIATEKYGLRKHIWDVEPNLWAKGAMYAWIVEVTFFWSTCFTKVSVLMFYRRLVEGSCSMNFKRSVWAGILFLVIYTVVFQILAMVTCNPLEAFWMQYDPNYTGYKCMSNDAQIKIVTVAGALSVVTDFYSVILPASLLLRIRISRRQKMGLLFVFSVGFVLVGVGIARTIFLHRSQAETIDKGYVSYNALAAGTAECNVAIVCACAPSLKMLFGRYFRDLTTKSNSYQMGGSKNSNSKNSSRTPRFGGGARSAEISASGTVFSVGDGCGDGHGGAAETGGETESSKGIWRTMDVEMYNNSNEVLEPETISECGDGNSSLREGRGDTTAVVGETV